MLNPKERRKKKIILGLTGSFGSGKSTVAKMFGSFGAKVIDADRIAHSLIRPGNKIYKRIIGVFGEDILRKNGIIDRKRLGEIVFNNKDLLKKLNKIIHPEVIRIMRRQIAGSSRRVIVLDAPLLIEAGLERAVDKLVVVKTSRNEQVERILRKYKRSRGKAVLSKADVLKRIKTQMPLSDKVRMADFVIDNSGTIKETKKQVEQIRRQLWKD